MTAVANLLGTRPEKDITEESPGDPGSTRKTNSVKAGFSGFQCNCFQPPEDMIHGSGYACKDTCFAVSGNMLMPYINRYGDVTYGMLFDVQTF